MKFNAEVQQVDRKPANSNEPIESQIDYHRTKIKHSDLVPVEVHISERASQLVSHNAGDKSVLDEASEGDQRPTGGGEEQAEEP